jgi:hypothetical protein
VQYLRLSVACVSALACLGASNLGASNLGASNPNGLVPVGPALLVQICAPNASVANCGPKLPKVSRQLIRDKSWPVLAKKAGVVSARGLTIACPPNCGAKSAGAVTVTLTARPTLDPNKGSYEFDGWQGACESAGKARTCTLRVEGKTIAKALFRPAY